MKNPGTIYLGRINPQNERHQQDCVFDCNGSSPTISAGETLGRYLTRVEVTNMADLKTVPIKEAWNSDAYKQLREKIKDGRQNWPFCKYCDFIDAGLRMDAVADILAGREMHGARQSLRRK